MLALRRPASIWGFWKPVRFALEAYPMRSGGAPLPKGVGW